MIALRSHFNPCRLFWAATYSEVPGKPKAINHRLTQNLWGACGEVVARQIERRMPEGSGRSCCWLNAITGLRLPSASTSARLTLTTSAALDRPEDAKPSTHEGYH